MKFNRHGFNKANKATSNYEAGYAAGYLGCGCFTFFVWLAFWVTIIYVAYHFINKWW